MRSGRNFPFGGITSLFTTWAALPSEASGPDHRRQDSQTNGPAVWPIVPVLSLPCLGRILLKGFEKHGVFLGFSEATYAAVYVCFSRTAGVQVPLMNPETWPHVSSSPHRDGRCDGLMKHCSIDPKVALWATTAIHSCSVSSWISEDKTFLQLSWFWWHCSTLHNFPSFSPLHSSAVSIPDSPNSTVPE